MVEMGVERENVAAAGIFMTNGPKRPRDASQLAHKIAVGIVTGKDLKHKPDTPGRSKGGKAIAEKLPPE